MKPVSEFSFYHSGAFVYESELCGIACSIDYGVYSSQLQRRIQELTQSYFNQWLLVVTAYQKLQNSLTSLNSNSDEPNDSATMSSYLRQSIHDEDTFRDYAYLFLISAKTFLDLFTCIVDIIESKEIRPENKLPDLATYATRKNNSDVIIQVEFERLRDCKQYPWIFLLKETRNRLIHRGYHLKPLFAFKKSNDLVMRVYKGTNFYELENISIGLLFDDFMRDMPVIEKTISNILWQKTKDTVTHKILSSFQYDGMISTYTLKETEEFDDNGSNS